MITDEIGMKMMLKEIFDINNNDELFTSDYFEGTSVDNVKMHDNTYEKIMNYLKNTTEVSLDVFLAINSTFAYGHFPEKFDVEIEEYISQNINVIINKLDSIKSLNNYLNKEIAQSYESIFTDNISYKLISNLISLCLHPPRLYKNIYFYGVQSLLLILSKYSHEEYSRWFLKTKRNDLKIIYAEAMLNSISSIDSSLEKNINSEIDFVRVLVKVFLYNIDRSMRYQKIQKYFFDLEQTKENLYFVLFYFSRCIVDLKNENSIQNLNVEINKASKYLNQLDKEMYEEFLDYVNISIIFGLTGEIEDNELKLDLFSVLFTSLNNKIKNEEFISRHSIEKADILGQTLLVLDDNILKIFLANFDNIINKMKEPYYIYKFYSSWGKQISILMHSLIAIFVYDKENNSTRYLGFKKKVLEVKKGFIHINDDYIRDILEKIK